MIVLKKSNTTDEIIVTLNEKRTLDAGYYIFLFKHFTTGEEIEKVWNFSEDDSNYPDRYNSFEIATSVLFADSNIGQWWYTVNESTDGVTAGLQVECGVMVLQPATEFTREEYTQEKNVKVYAG